MDKNIGDILRNQDLKEIVKELKKFDIELSKEKLYEYTLESSIKLEKQSLLVRYPHTEQYGEFIHNLNRVWTLFLEIDTRNDDNFNGYEFKIQPKCEACLILLIGALETYLSDKFYGLAKELKMEPIDKTLYQFIKKSRIRISFQNNKEINKSYKALGIQILKFHDEERPLSEDEKILVEEWEKEVKLLWDKVLADDISYAKIRNKIVHHYTVSEWKKIDRPFIKNCIIDITNLVHKFEGKINRECANLINLFPWSESILPLRPHNN